MACFIALAMFDQLDAGGNRDGKIDASDAVFARLQLWQDQNHDGISQPEELFSLPRAGVRALSLSYSLVNLIDENGNAFRYAASIEAERGASVGPLAYDVYLRALHGQSMGGERVQTDANQPCYDCWQCRATCFSARAADGILCYAVVTDFRVGTTIDFAEFVAEINCISAANSDYGGQTCIFNTNYPVTYNCKYWPPAPPPTGGCN